MTVRTLFFACLVWILAASAPDVLAADEPSYRVRVSVDYALGTYAGSLDVRYANRTAVSLDEIYFRLHPNAGDQFGDASLVVTLASVNGAEVPASAGADAAILRVPLAAPLAPGSAVDIGLEFHGRASRLQPCALWTDYGFLARTAAMMTLSAFCPTVAPYTDSGWALDPGGSNGSGVFVETSTYDLQLDVCPGVTLVPIADQAAVLPDGTVRYFLSRVAVRDLSLVLLDGARTPIETTIGGLTIRCWFASGHSEVAASSLGLAAAGASVYAARFGPLPWPVVDLVEAPLGPGVGGLKLSGVSLVSNLYGKAPIAPDFETLLLHELAHQWFYAAVGSDPRKEPWLDEAFATYASSLALDAVVSASAAQRELAKWSSEYTLYKIDSPGLRITDPADAFPDSYTYLRFVYFGGAVVLHELRLAIGDEAFFAALADYCVRQNGAIATGDNFIASFDRFGGGDMARRLLGGEPETAP